MLAFQGYGMRQDYLAAKRYFHGCDLEMGDSHYMLGLIYYEGHGLKKNTSKARRHFLEAATLGDPKGQFMTAFMFQGGEGQLAEKAEPLKAFIFGAWSAKINGYSDADSILEFSKMQLSSSVQEKAPNWLAVVLTAAIPPVRPSKVLQPLIFFFFAEMAKDAEDFSDSKCVGKVFGLHVTFCAA